MGLGEALAPSLSHESPAAAGHCHSITDRVAYSSNEKVLIALFQLSDPEEMKANLTTAEGMH